MNIVDSMISLNQLLYERNGKVNRLYSLPRILVRKCANIIIPRVLNSDYTVKECSLDKEHVIVSLTTFPSRINNVWMVVECMLRQTYSPEKIILWLSRKQFGKDFRLPSQLQKRICERFEVRYVEEDIRSYKKFYYVAQEYPDSLIFLVDDDIFYHSKILENTIKAHKKHPNAVICNYGYRMQYDESGILMPYTCWRKEVRFSNADNLFFGSGGGTLICPHNMHKDLCRKDLFLQLAPIADDIWLNAMARLSELKKIMLKNGLILPIQTKEDVKLASSNRILNKNDEQLKHVSNYYLSNIGIDPFSSSDLQ